MIKIMIIINCLIIYLLKSFLKRVSKFAHYICNNNSGASGSTRITMDQYINSILSK